MTRKNWYICAGQGRTDDRMTIVQVCADSPGEAWLLFSRYFDEADAVLPKSILCCGPSQPTVLWRAPEWDSDTLAEMLKEYEDA